MATASATTTSSQINRSIQPRTSASSPASMPSCRVLRMGRFGDHFGAFPALWCGSRQAESVRDRSSGDLQCALYQASASVAADIDKQGVVWVSLASGHLGSFDRTQMQRTAKRAESYRRSLPRGLVVFHISRSRLSKVSAKTALSRVTTPGSTSTTRSASARTCRCPPAI